MSLNIYIARHGQNVDNANGILNGRRDLPLTDLGRQQAKELSYGIKEAGLKFDAIYSSPLIRAYETAEIVSELLEISDKPLVLPEIIEREFGIMTGVPIKEIVPRCGSDVIVTDTITYFREVDGSESFPDLVTRGGRALEIVKSRHRQGGVLLVCHGDIGKMIYAAATEKHWRDVLHDFHFGNCDLIEIGSHHQAHRIKLPQHNL